MLGEVVFIIHVYHIIIIMLIEHTITLTILYYYCFDINDLLGTQSSDRVVEG